MRTRGWSAVFQGKRRREVVLDNEAMITARHGDAIAVQVNRSG